MLGWTFQSQGKFPEMEAAFRDVLRLKPDHAGGHHGLGRALFRQKKSRDAIAPLREAVRLGSKDHWVYDALGWALVGKENPPRRRPRFGRSVRLKPDLVNGHIRPRPGTGGPEKVRRRGEVLAGPSHRPDSSLGDVSCSAGPLSVRESLRSRRS